MSATLPGLAAVLLAIGCTLGLLRQSWLTAHLPLPPGPTPIPLLGNVFGVNKDAPYLTHTAWSKRYGNIIYIRVLNRGTIILNSEEVAIALLDKRPRKYSDRPASAIAELVRLGLGVLYIMVFNANAALTYCPKQLHNACEMLTQLLGEPAHYGNHFSTFSATVVMAVTYGYDVKHGEPWGTSMQRAGDIFFRIPTPEIAAVRAAFPFLKVLPTWVPGVGFKSKAAECRRLTSEVLSALYAWIKRRLEEGSAMPSLVADAITRYRLWDDSKNPDLVQAIKFSAGTLYAVTVETTSSSLFMFVYLTTDHQEVQLRAQEEIDRVVGRQRLPDFEDRWRPVAPLDVPHATTEDDVYQGYYIPKANLWAISQDEKRYPNTEAFIPERLLQADGTLNEDNNSWAFGFGRRICPGKYVADTSLWAAIVCILALFKIEKTEGSENVEWMTGMTTHPLPFPCAFVPRDEEMDTQKLAPLIYASRVDS